MVVRWSAKNSWIYLFLMVASFPSVTIARGQSRPRPNKPEQETEKEAQEENNNNEAQAELEAMVQKWNSMILPKKDKPASTKSPWLKQLYEESLQKENGIEEAQEEGNFARVGPPKGHVKEANGKSWLLVKIVGDNENKLLEKTLSEDRAIRLLDCKKHVCYCYMPVSSYPKYNDHPLVRAMDIPVGVREGHLRQQQRNVAARSLVGSVTNEAFQAMRVDQVRATYGLTGRNMTIGVISDSFDTLGGYAQDVASGDLPPNIAVLREYSGEDGIDEGRAMMQLIYDLLPDAKFAFYTGYEDPVAFADGITALANYGCDVIVDDIGWYTEPYFQDGVIAQAANDVAEIRGIPYFSAAGNEGQDSWQGPFQGSGFFFGSCELHNFGDTFGPTDVLQEIQIGDGDSFFFQWDDLHFSLNGVPGAQSDIDIYIFDSTTDDLLGVFDAVEIGQDPIIDFAAAQAPEDNIALMAITHCSGPEPTLMKWIRRAGFNSTIDFDFEYNAQSSTIFGHRNAAYVASIGAADYQETPVFGTDPAIVESYSSSGGTPILFDRDGNRLPGFGETRLKPLVVAPDKVINTYFGIEAARSPNGPGFYFPGTSAAAPNAAAVAALLLEAEPTLGPREINRLLSASAEDMEDEGFDFRTGYGLVNAFEAVSLLGLPTPSTTPVYSPTALPPISLPPMFLPAVPTSIPSDLPSSTPSDIPSSIESDLPSSIPSYLPSSIPSDLPSSIPSYLPSSIPSDLPSSISSSLPSSIPSDLPSSIPTDISTTSEPTAAPTGQPMTALPTGTPTSSFPPGTCPDQASCPDGSYGTCKQPLPDQQGCSCPGCECKVCQVDPHCCTNIYDGLCVLVANSLCTN